MNFFKLVCCASLLWLTTADAFKLSDVTGRVFEDKSVGVESQLNDAAFELKVKSALLRDKSLMGNTHIIVSRNGSSVLIAGQAASQELKDKVQRLLLSEAHLQWTQGDVNEVKPSNAQVCGEKASKTAANARRRFNLKTAEECTTVNRFYNEVRVSRPIGEIEQSNDDLLRATIVNGLLHAAIIKKAETINVVVSDSHVYLLGDQLDQSIAQRAIAFVSDMSGVEKVVPLFRF